MRNLSKITVVLLCILAFSLEISAQKRKQNRQPKLTAQAQITGSAEKISIQIVNLTRFLYILGGVAKGIEEIDEQAKQKKISQALIDKNFEFKRKTIQSIKDIVASLAALEVEFRTKAELKNYQSKIAGITDIAVAAEEQASNGNFTESGKTLLLVVEKLTATLVSMTSK
ncbi:MAG: hypothetical protein N2Z23_03360 [Pyrinomonadaceae bacterium]|nr:hypothetical protein [Pyrinomonadaceae bacterium]MCX7639465.1 hypothetical protein [Pyrinomonadaceae bacterium]MDW8304484.1 hypothetical protein [Acidobacteriota bacterium]